MSECSSAHLFPSKTRTPLFPVVDCQHPKWNISKCISSVMEEFIEIHRNSLQDPRKLPSNSFCTANLYLRRLWQCLQRQPRKHKYFWLFLVNTITFTTALPFIPPLVLLPVGSDRQTRSPAPLPLILHYFLWVLPAKIWWPHGCATALRYKRCQLLWHRRAKLSAVEEL